MSDIQRWQILAVEAGNTQTDDGAWVTYADHVEALRQAEQRGRESLMRDLWGER